MHHADRRMVEESHDMWIDVGFEAEIAVLGLFSKLDVDQLIVRLLFFNSLAQLPYQASNQSGKQ